MIKPEGNRSGRNHQFDILRLIFATCVLLSHAPEIIDGNASREIFTRLSGGAVSFGSLGVDGFFLLSGFLIVKSWLADPELGNFLRKRLLRIVPGYMVAAFLSTVLIGLLAPGVPQFFRHFNLRFPASILTLSSPLTPPVFPGLHYNLVDGAMWTITYEFRCYLLVALFGVLGLLRGRTAWLVTTVLMLAMLLSPIHLHWPKIVQFLIGNPDQIFRLTAAYMVGGCFYLYREQISFRRIFVLASVLILILLRIFNPVHFEAALIVCGGYLLFHLGHLHFRSLAWMKNYPDISYGVYLYGWPVQCFWIWYFHGSPWTTFLVSVVLCYGLGWLSWHFVERPMLKLKRHSTAPLPAT